MNTLFANTLDITLVLGVTDAEVNLSRLSSTELPWLENPGEPHVYQLRTIIEGRLLHLLNRKKPMGKQLVPTIEKLSVELSSHLKSALEISCDIRLHLVMEEFKNGALQALGKRLRFDNPDALHNSLKERGSVVMKTSETVSVQNAKAQNIGAKIKIVAASLDPVPGSLVSFTLLNEDAGPLLVTSVKILHQEKTLLNFTLHRELPSGTPVSLDMTAIPVLNYGRLLTSEESLTVEVTLRGRKEPVRLALPSKSNLPELEKSPVTLFYDMGSSQFKQMRVNLLTPPRDTDSDRSHWEGLTRSRLGDSETHRKSFEIPVPCPSVEIVTHFELPEFRKEQIDRFDDLQLAAHFAGAIQLVANSYHSRERRLIADFFWAFPNIRSRDFKKINAEVNRLVAPSILGTATIVEEADCLRSHFAKPLNLLASEANQAAKNVKDAKEKKKELESALETTQKAWNEYSQKGFFRRAWKVLTGNRPPEPDDSDLKAHRIPTLEEWHTKFESIACDSVLSDFLVFDAGGYTLDVYGSIKGQSGRVAFSKSYRAGSNLITLAVRDKLALERNVDCKEIDIKEAERLKCQYCGEDHAGKGVLPALCQDTSMKIYKQPIDEVIDWLVHHKFTKGFPVILSGGGTRNQHLRKLLAKMFEAHNIHTVPVDSNLIYGTLHESKGSDGKDHRLFSNVVSGFNLDDEFPRYAPLTDVIGGMASMALHGADTKNKS
jgi:hypothetical protein